jgi:hypothetical protein
LARRDADRFEPASLVVEVAEIIVHEGDKPNAVDEFNDVQAALPGF